MHYVKYIYTYIYTYIHTQTPFTLHQPSSASILQYVHAASRQHLHPAGCKNPSPAPWILHLSTFHLSHPCHSSSLPLPFSSRFLLFLLHTADLDAAAVTGVAPAAARSYVDRFDAGCCWHRCCYRGLVSNSRQAKTKLSAALVSSFYRLWTGEQRRAAIHVRRKRIFTGISMDRHGKSDVSPPPRVLSSTSQGLIGSYPIKNSHDSQRGNEFRRDRPLLLSYLRKHEQIFSV